MKPLFVALYFLLLSPQSFGFFPKVECQLEMNENGPLTIHYVGDGLITVAHGQSSCEMDYDVSRNPAEGWVNFINNNGNIGGEPFNSRCRPMLQSLYANKEEGIVDIQRLSLSKNLVDETLRLQELKKENPVFLGRIFFFVKKRQEDFPGVLASETMTCRVAE